METTNDTTTSNDKHPGAIPTAAPDVAVQEAESDLLAEKAALFRRSTTRHQGGHHGGGGGGDAQARMNVLLQTGVLGDDSTAEQSEGINLARASNSSATGGGTRRSSTTSDHITEVCVPTDQQHQSINRPRNVSRVHQQTYQSEKVVAKEQQEEATRLQMDVLLQVGVLSAEDPTERSDVVDELVLAKGKVANSRSETRIDEPESSKLEGHMTKAEWVGTGTNNADVAPPALVQGSPLPIVSTPGAHRAFPSSSQETIQNEAQESGDPPSPCLFEREGTIMIGMDGSEQEQLQQNSQQRQLLLHQTVILEEGVLAQASPVDDLDVPHQSAELLDLEKHRASIKQKQQKHISATLQLVLVGLLLLLIVVIGLSVGLTRLNENSTASVEDGIKEPTPSPTSWTWDLPFTIPNSTLAFLYHDTEQTSPQFRAYKWMKKDPYLNGYPEARLQQRFVLVTFYYATGGETWTHQGGGIITVEAPAFGTLTEFTPNQTMPSLPHHPPPPPQNEPSSSSSHGSENEKPKREIVQYHLTSEPWLSYEHSECEWFNTGLASPYLRPACDEDGNYQQLDLTFNNLHGALPPELGLLTTLKVIGLGRNHIGGPIFTEIGYLHKLEGIHLAGSTNQVTGSLPSEIGLLSDTLRTISLNSNDLSGTIPTEFWQLSNLNEIKLSRNKMSGTLPSNIGHFLPNLKQLLLRWSDLSGTIPTSLGLLTGLVHLDLGDSQFVGSIPTELGKLDLLTRLFLHENQLSGQVPSELGLLSFLRDMWLPQNDGITGQLPPSLAKLNGTLGSLRIAGTGIRGTIPPGLCGIDEILFDCSETLCGCQMCPCQEQ